MEKSELFEARTNPEFLDFLEKARQKSIEEKNISLMYETLDSMLVLDLDEKKINELYDAILKTAFDSIDDILHKDKKLKLEGVQLLYVRAVYEHCLEKWTYDNFDGAKQLAFILANIIDDERLKKALDVLIICLSKDESFDSFYENKVNQTVSEDEIYGYFIVDFSFDIEKFLKENQKILENEYKNLNYLLGK